MTRARDHARGVDRVCVVGDRQHGSPSPEGTTSRARREVVPSGLKKIMGRVVPRHRRSGDAVGTPTVSWASFDYALRAHAEERPHSATRTRRRALDDRSCFQLLGRMQVDEEPGFCVISVQNKEWPVALCLRSPALFSFCILDSLFLLALLYSSSITPLPAHSNRTS
jgi:hypothetical protein